MKLLLYSFIFLMILLILKIPQKIKLFFQNLQNATNSFKRPHYQQKRPEEAKILDEMKACEICGTYIPSQMAFYFEKQTYCSQQCLVKAKNKR
ncbi:MAG: hypothetical protein H7A32_03205 [Deltaproteobacteria bacterium]|nr:hypothetical protein [Deltaproteobacteria bacterium]